MKIALILFFCPIFALADVQKEAEAYGLNLQKSIEAIFAEQKNPTDILLHDRQAFKAPDGDSFEKTPPCPFEIEIIAALEKSQTIDKIDPDEPFLTLPIEIKKTSADQEEADYETCQESPAKRYHIQKYKKVTQIAAVTKQAIFCNGNDHHHKSEEKVKKHGDAEEKKNRRRSELERARRHGDVKHYEVWITDGKWNSSYKVKKRWWHKDGIACSDHRTITTQIAPPRTEITWEIPDTPLLDWLSQFPDCRLLATSFLSPTQEELVYECGGGEEAKCHHIRLRGGQIVEKNCIETDPDGECVTYQKTYELPQKPPAPILEVQLDGENIWGISELSQQTTADPDFGNSITKLAAASQILGAEGGGSPLQAQVFPGHVMRCHTSFFGRNVHDCCGVPCKNKKELGVALSVGLIDCSVEENKLFEARKMGKCVYVGKEWKKLHLISERTYICFPSILSRIIQTQGRAQLGLDFGDVKTPKPEGFSIPQLQNLRFDEMNFYDFISTLDIPLDKEKLSQKLKEKTAEFEMKQSTHATETLLKGQLQCQN